MSKLRGLGLTLFTSLMLIMSLSVVSNAATGNWTSSYRTDYNGMSEVGTTRKSSGAVNCTLKVITGSGATVGSKTVGVTKDQTVSHICWGQPLLSRAGKVYISGSHSPYFNE